MRRAKVHPRRIVVLDDELYILELYEMLLPFLFGDRRPLRIVTFTDSAKAMCELLRESPDLFITDFNHTGLSCEEMFKTLAERGIKYPIFVVTASTGAATKKYLSKLGRTLGLTITHQAKPCLPDDWRKLMRRFFHLG